MTDRSIIFPNLGIYLKNVGDGIDIFNFHIAFYGMVIALGMLVAVFFISKNAIYYGYKEDDFLDMTIVGIVSGVIGARIYYVIFAWDYYKDNLLGIFNLRQGGLAIYGGIIAGFLSVVVMSRIKKIPLLRSGDIVIGGVLIGQIFGRWGNFFNREAFGGYTNGLFAMGIPIEAVRSSSDITQEMLDNTLVLDGVEFIQVHPTFLYESLWNLGIFILLLVLRKRVKTMGVIPMLYFLLYGIGRFFIESLRTDQLLLPGTTIPVSMVVSVICVVVSLGVLLKVVNKTRPR